MRSGLTGRVGSGMLAVLLVLCMLVPIAWGQTENAPGPPVPSGPDPPASPWIDESNAELFVMLLSLVVLGVVTVAKAMDLKRKRGQNAVRPQAETCYAMLHDPTQEELRPKGSAPEASGHRLRLAGHPAIPRGPGSGCLPQRPKDRLFTPLGLG